MKIFIDTSAFYALAEPRDDNHKQSLRLKSVLLGKPLFTSNLVLYETYTLLRYRCGYNAMRAFIDGFDANLVTVIYSNDVIEHASIDLLKKYSDKELSFVDCSSFAIMKMYDIDTAFTFDSDFEKVGFHIL